MPIKKQRSVTGLTNKSGSSSILNKPAAGTSSTANTSKVDCVCKICSCGRHRCTGSNHSNVASVGGGASAHMNADTESRAQYVSHQLPEHKLVKMKVELPPVRPLEGVSETKSEYIARPLPPRHPRHENKYEKNANKLEGESESHEKYRSWPIPERPVKFKKANYQVQKDDRQFQTTSNADYVAPPAASVHVPTKRKQAYVPNVNKFEGMSTQASDFTSFDIVALRANNPNTSPDAMKKAARHDRQGTFSVTNNSDKFVASSEYTDIYQYRQQSASGRSAPGKRINAAQYAPNPNKFEGVSTQQDDYRAPSAISKDGLKVYQRVQSFKPAELIRGSEASKNMHKADDRDFHTETKDGFVPKKLNVCPVSARGAVPQTKGEDGHMYYGAAEEVAQALKQVALA